ncbi:MAG: 3-hydroxyacyl-CoA dehydrogenase NAD-binding domain-containing protein [Gemmatimonadota bacterium]
MPIKRVVVVGGGTMGHGIALVCARAGLEVSLVEVSNQASEAALGAVKGKLDRDVSKGRITEEEREASLSRLSGELDAGRAAGGADIVIEAIPEQPEAKLDLFRLLDREAPAHAILASNTSSISITSLAGATTRPGRVIGMHFMNPVPRMELVEVVRGMGTDEATVKAVNELSVRLGKTPVVVNDSPGFVANRVLMPMINEAIFALMEGVADADAIDQIMQLGANHPMGPLRLADLIGLDTCLLILEVLHRDLGDDRYRPCPLLRRHVAAGWLGRKSGRGFHSYGA